MHLLSALLLALSANVDNFAVAIAYGIKRLRIGLLTNLFIALVSAVGTFLSISVGEELSGYLSVGSANLLGSLLLVMVGLRGIWDTLRHDRIRARRGHYLRQEQQVVPVSSASDGTLGTEEVGQEFSQEFIQEFSYESFLERPEKADRDQSGFIDVRESIALAFGLTLNNLGVGIGAGISELNVGLTTILTFSLSVLAVVVGHALGIHTFKGVSGLLAGLISGTLIVITGIYEYFVL